MAVVVPLSHPEINGDPDAGVASDPMSRVLTHTLSFDIEDWFHIVEIDALDDPSKWPDLPSLVVPYTQWIVDTVTKAGHKATFFMLGWIAERHPELAPMIAAAGHEIASHSYWHRRVDQLTPEEFAADLARSIEVLENQTGQKVRGFRAPSFSITPGAEWAFDVMHDQGIEYDASLFPAKHGHGGYPCRQEIHPFADAPSGRAMTEIPMSVLRMGPWRLPFSGGGYLRALPHWVINHGFQRFASQGTPVVVYLHPRDFAVDCPRVPMPLKRRFKCYTGLHTAKAKLERLLADYRFDTCAAAAAGV